VRRYEGQFAAIMQQQCYRFWVEAMGSHSIAKIIDEVEKSTRLRVYSKKYSVISYIYENEIASPSSVLANCSLSSSTFFSLLQQLKNSGIIRSTHMADTALAKCYGLSDDVRGFLDSMYLSIDDWMRHRIYVRERSSLCPLYQHVQTIEDNLGIQYYSIEFRIVIQLYDLREARAIDLFNSGRFSSTSFYYTLKRLTDMGVVNCTAAVADSRSKIYRLSDHVRAVLDHAHRRIVDLGLLLAA
jgi:DNA-binding PadR family transcriptional regulator